MEKRSNMQCIITSEGEESIFIFQLERRREGEKEKKAKWVRI